jgi:uncharacterized lipoprotein NlpE involved in copper resistance
VAVTVKKIGRSAMRNAIGSVMIAGIFAFCTIAGLTAAKADVVRIAIVTADNQADFDKNNAMSETAKALLMKGNGVKAVYILADPAKLTVASVSVWPSEADVHSVTDTANWKSFAGTLKSKTYTVEVFELK